MNCKTSFINMMAVTGWICLNAFTAGNELSELPPSRQPKEGPAIRKLGTIDCDLVETTPAFAAARNINNSDIDFCEYKGKLIINYSWGNQQGTEFLAEAVFDGSLKEFIKALFPN